MTILHVESSINGANSVSRAISRSILAELAARHPEARIITRDLVAEPLPHLTLDAFADNPVLEEFLGADIVVVGAPMYNFGIPSHLKAWIDRLAVAGKTFRYTEKGPEGLAGGKKLIIGSSRGGFYGSDTPLASFDYQENYLRAFFGFLGVTDITFVRAEGVAIGPEMREKAIEAAKAEVMRLAA